MYTISTAALVFIVALALSLAVVVQATNHFKDPLCMDYLPAQATSCNEWRKYFSKPQPSEEDLTKWVFEYNDGVNRACDNLILQDNVRAFLL